MFSTLLSYMHRIMHNGYVHCTTITMAQPHCTMGILCMALRQYYCGKPFLITMSSIFSTITLYGVLRLCYINFFVPYRTSSVYANLHFYCTTCLISKLEELIIVTKYNCYNNIIFKKSLWMFIYKVKVGIHAYMQVRLLV